MSEEIQGPKQVGPDTVTDTLAAHQQRAGGALDGHIAKSATRLQSATRRTSNAIGEVGDFVKDHTPAAASGTVDYVVGRARRYIDEGHA